MSSDRGARSVTNMATLVPPLVVVDASFDGEGLTYTLRHAIETDAGVPGYVFAVSERGTAVGEAALMITDDRESVARIGHMGCELEPTFRKRGYVPRLARGLFPFARQHGLRELLITCDVGHESQRESILSLGATELDELPAVGTDPAKQRFVLDIADGA